MTITKNDIVKAAQWLIIVLLAILCFYFWRESKTSNDSVITNAQYSKSENQEVVISEDESLNELKKENNNMYESIVDLSDVESAMQIKYVTIYGTDTVWVGSEHIQKDSIYEYSQETDTVSYDLRIKGQEVEWFDLDISIRDSMMIVLRSKNGYNETTITHSNYTEVSDATIYTPKETFTQKVKSKLYFGVGVGAGYGIINNKPDIYIGINAGIKF